MLNAFTVDVEDYYQVSGFENQICRSTWCDYESRVVNNTTRLLSLLRQFEVRGTFFVLGWVARRFPGLVRDIALAGHEIGSHSYWHRLIYNLTPHAFRQDLLDSRAVLEDITGRPITIYRAPSFSITLKSLWALDILAEEGFQCDSSIFPIQHDRYGIPGANRFPHEIHTQSGVLQEFPASIIRFGRFSIPVSGGGYFRLYPVSLTLQGARCINRRHQQPFLFYIHPWEIDPDQPRLPMASRLTRARHYVGLAGTEAKLKTMLKAVRFGTVSEVLVEHRLNQVCENGSSAAKRLLR